jgi:hypothetical protein
MNQTDNQHIPELPASSAIVLPPSLDDQSAQRTLADVAARAADAPLVMNARQCMFATPYALAVLLAIAEERAVKPTFIPPSKADTAAYWARARFFRYAEELYAIRGTVPHVRWASESDVMLEMTRIPGDETAGAIVQRVRERVLDLVLRAAHIDADAAATHADAVASACLNVANSDGRNGWVMAQVVHYRKQAGQRGVLIGIAGPGGTGTAFKIDGPISP